MEQASETGLDEHLPVHATRLYTGNRRQLHHKEPVHRQQRTDDLPAPAQTQTPAPAPPELKSSNRHSLQEAAGPARQAIVEVVHRQATAEAAHLQAVQAIAEDLAEASEDKYRLKP